MKEKKRGPGRPPKGDKALTGRIQVKVMADEEADIRAAAKRAGETASTWSRPILVERARDKKGGGR